MIGGSCGLAARAVRFSCAGRRSRCGGRWQM